MKRASGMQRLGLAAAMCSLCLLWACPPPVDPALEVASNDWSSKIGAFLASVEEKAGTPEGAYEANKQFYSDVEASIDGHIQRIQSGSNNRRFVDVLRDLSRSIETLRRLHESNGNRGITRAVGEPARQVVESELRSLERLQAEYRSARSAP